MSDFVALLHMGELKESVSFPRVSHCQEGNCNSIVPDFQTDSPHA